MDLDLGVSPVVGIVMGSASDQPKMQPAEIILDRFGVPYESNIISAHRTPDQAHEYSKLAEERGLEVIIAAAGRAAHLAGVMAANTTLPVIGVPIFGGHLGGADSLYSTVQMPSGTPVATVGLDQATNAAILSVQILATKHPQLRDKLRLFKQELAQGLKV
ncbi:MAG TPA: 5-(carboxyamino)imidazole ribonucleotide mutase [Actinomycetota bacterium]|jgi:5-(carboxyamino)imidazole ribonucleotide mutase|nr:5-(carboxyamino)imidazole ribonucleotide mutase [Actinomycetota bacterium]